MKAEDSDDDSSSSEHEQEQLEEVTLVQDSWVQCDRCQKWRRIPQGVASSLQEDAAWWVQPSFFILCLFNNPLCSRQVHVGPFLFDLAGSAS